jgi:hypothetical protein
VHWQSVKITGCRAIFCLAVTRIDIGSVLVLVTVSIATDCDCGNHPVTGVASV